LFLFFKFNLFLSLSISNLIIHKKLPYISLLIKELIKVINKQHRKVDLFIFKCWKSLYMFISEIELFKLNERFINEMIILKQCK